MRGSPKADEYQTYIGNDVCEKGRNSKETHRMV